MACSLLVAGAVGVSAAIVVPGANGTDGALNITNDTVIDLSQAVTAAWDSDNAANAGKGVYDSNKWAVVFKYTDVNIAAGATVTFNNHPSRAPVVWLVSGDVVVDGTVSLNGQNAVSAPNLAEPGPGGFRGGAGIYNQNAWRGAGFGPGGGRASGDTGQGGAYATVGASQFATPPGLPYGNPSLIPLIGGSGGGGDEHGIPSLAGAGGGGAILVGCQNSVTVHGAISANGGNAGAWAGQGSGGAVRIVCDSLLGAGAITAATGGTGGYSGGLGRIRLERVNSGGTISPTPAPSTVDLDINTVALLWPPMNAPEIRVISIGGEAAPADPRATFGTHGADVNLPVSAEAVVYVETVYVEPESQVRVRLTPRDTFDAVEVGASIIATNNLSPLTLLWSASVPANLGYSAVQAKVIRP